MPRFNFITSLVSKSLSLFESWSMRYAQHQNQLSMDLLNILACIRIRTSHSTVTIGSEKLAQNIEVLDLNRCVIFIKAPLSANFSVSRHMH